MDDSDICFGKEKRQLPLNTEQRSRAKGRIHYIFIVEIHCDCSKMFNWNREDLVEPRPENYYLSKE